MESYDQPVRASRNLSVAFTLLMVSSSGFGSYAYYRVLRTQVTSLKVLNFSLYELRAKHVYALLTLGFPVAPPDKGLACSMHKLVGSFFNRHAVIQHLFYKTIISKNALRFLSLIRTL